MQVFRVYLQPTLTKYVSETVPIVKAVREFVYYLSPSWIDGMQAHVNTIKRIKKDEADDSDEKDLAELTETLNQVRGSLRRLDQFLDAMEKLSVTSAYVFQVDNPGFRLVGDADLELIREIIRIAQVLGPLLILFKRNNDAFFQPNLYTMEVLHHQLEKYIEIIQKICDTWKKSNVLNFQVNCPVVEVKEGLSDDVIDDNCRQIVLLDKIRFDRWYRVTYLFQGRDETFKTEYEQRKSDMKDFLRELEGAADQLDSMSHGSNVTGLVTSSVGIVGGVLSILGLIFAPFTAGVSLALTTAGTVVSISSGVASVVTSVTEIGVNEAQARKAKGNFKDFFENSNAIRLCMDKVIQEHFNDLHRGNIETGLYMGIPLTTLDLDTFSIPGLFKDIKAFRATGQLAAESAEEAAKFVSKAGKVLSKLSGPLTVAFMGVDIYGVVYHTKNLQNGCESETAKWIRARVALWRTEVDSLKDLYDCVNRARLSQKEWKGIVHKHF